MAGDDLSEFREEMRKRGLYKKPPVRLRTRKERAERDARYPTRSIEIGEMSIKRLAWAFGCASPDSETESQLYRALVEKVRGILEARRG